MNRGQADEGLAPRPEGQVGSQSRDRWEDLVLPQREKKVLRSAVAELDARRAAEPGPTLGSSPGLTLLLAGEAGTGKTMAAQLIAADLGVGIVRVDLLGVSSQEPVEAANQIDHAFAEAEKSRAVLVFDRADALLDASLPAKRPRQKRARANEPSLELAKLVERSHGAPGAVVFTSRLSPRLAGSLRDGMDFVVEFPFPWSDARKEIWRQQLPADAEVTDEDLEYLAASFMDSGATIRDCCVAATAAAAKEGVPVGMIHIGRALDREYRTRLTSPRATDALAKLLGAGAAGAAAAGAAAQKSAARAPAKPAAAKVAPAAPKPVPEPPKTPQVAPRSAPAAPKIVPAPAASTPAVEPAPAKPPAEPAQRRPAALTPYKPATEPTPREGATEPAPREPDADPAPTEPDAEPTPREPAADPALAPTETIEARIAAALGHSTAAPPSSKPGSASAADDSAPTEPALVPAKPDRTPEKPFSLPPKKTPPRPRAQPALVTAPIRDRVPPRSSLSPVAAALALAGILIAAVLGFAIARSTGGTASSTAPEKSISAGPVQVTLPSTWHAQSVPATQSRGLADAIAVGPTAPAHGLLVIGTSNADNRYLLSQPLRIAVSDKSPANVVTLGGLNFNLYPNISVGSVYALPTTAGTVFAVCLTGGAPAGFSHGCERVLSTLTLTSGRVLPPGQDATYTSAVNQAMSKLNTVRSKASSQLRHARTAHAQAVAANELAAAHTAAASALSRLTGAGPATAANSAVVAALRATAGAYTALGRAAAANDDAAYGQASSAITRADHSLQSALARLGNLGYQVG